MPKEEYKSFPIPDNTLIGDLAMPRFLKAYDLTDRWHVKELTVTISKANFEEIYDKEARKKKMVPVIYFKTKTGETFPRGVCLDSAKNVANLRKATGASTKGELIGKQITIKAESVRAFGEDWDVLRISPKTPTNGAQPQVTMPEPPIDGLEPLEDEPEEEAEVQS